MRLVIEDPAVLESTPSSARYLILVTGDGPDDIRVVKGLGVKFNGGDKYLFIAKRPLTRQRKTGLASLEVVRIYIEKFSIKRLIWTCDREHLRLDQGWIEQIKNALNTFGMKVDVEKEWNGGIRLKLALGEKETLAWCALTGKERSIEENLSELIWLEFKQSVRPEKQDIDKFLKDKRLEVEDVVGMASKENLRQSMTSLYSVFNDLDR